MIKNNIITFFICILFIFSFNNTTYAQDDSNKNSIQKLSEKFKDLYNYDYKLKKISLNFDNEIYFLDSSQETNIMFGLEFLKEDNKNKNFKDLITICQLKNDINFYDYVKMYLESTKKIRYLKPEIYENKNLKDNLIIDQVLIDIDNNKYEHCIIRIIKKDNVIKTYAHSKMVNLDYINNNKDQLKTEIADKRSNWLNEIIKFDFNIFP